MNLRPHLVILALTALLGLQPLALASKIPTAKIIGGSDAGPGNFPFVVALVNAGDDFYSGQFCAGSLVTSQHVVTAAHCLKNLEPSDLVVVANIYDLSADAGVPRNVAKITMHPDYDGSDGSSSSASGDDIAILTLSEPVNSVTPISMISRESFLDLSAGDLFTAIGWGNTSVDTMSPNYPEILQSVALPLVSDTQCRDFWGNAFDEKMVCAGFDEGGKDTCSGDSGGPLMVFQDAKWQLVGVTSFGFGCAEANSPAIYSSVSDYMSWINSVIADFDFSISPMNYFVPFDREQTLTLTFEAGKFSISNATVVSSSNVQAQSVTNNCSDLQASSCSIAISYTPAASGFGALSINMAASDLPFEMSFPVYFDALPALNVANLDGALLTPSLVSVYSGGDQPWARTLDVGTVGSVGLASGDIGSYESSVLILVADEADTASFDYRSSSERNYDFLDILVNGELLVSNSGETSFISVSDLDLTQEKTITFIYRKDASLDQFNDSAYVDNVAFAVSNAQQSQSDDTDAQNADDSSNDITLGTDLRASGVTSGDGGGGGSLSLLYLLSGLLLLLTRIGALRQF